MSGEPPLVLDVTGRDIQGEGDVLRQRGPAVRVQLPDGVPAWAAGRSDVLRRLLTDPRVSRSAKLHWSAWRRGEIPDDWPLRLWAQVEHMGSAYGGEHRRLRGLVGGAFTSARTAALRPRIEALVDDLLERVAALPDPVVDLRRHFALPLPTEVISELFGVPDGMRGELCADMTAAFDTGADPATTHSSVRRIFALLNELVELRRGTPGDDVTSAMLAQHDEQGAAFSHAEIVDTLSLMVAAGYETTANLLDHAVAALLTHPDQLDLVRAGTRSWQDVIEETLRWQAPIAYLPLRYAVEDIDVDGVRIPGGEAIIVSYAAAGRDRDVYGATADDFDISRAEKRHLSFGHGVHHCVGAPLARLEAQVALPAVFARFPELSLAVPAAELAPLRSFLTNGHAELPVRLTRRDRSSAGSGAPR